MKDYKFCTKCGNKSRLTANVCSNCGSRFRKVLIKAQSELCPQCSSIHPTDAKFCRICGYQFAPTVPAEPPIEQPFVPGVELPPAAIIPPMPPQQPEPIAPRSATGLILTVDELKRLRKMQTEQIILYPRSRRKPNR